MCAVYENEASNRAEKKYTHIHIHTYKLFTSHTPRCSHTYNKPRTALRTHIHIKQVVHTYTHTHTSILLTSHTERCTHIHTVTSLIAAKHRTKRREKNVTYIPFRYRTRRIFSKMSVEQIIDNDLSILEPIIPNIDLTEESNPSVHILSDSDSDSDSDPDTGTEVFLSSDSSDSENDSDNVVYLSESSDSE